MADLLIDIGVAHDGAGDQLGEEGNVQGKIQNIALHLAISPVQIHHIGQRLEGEEGDADGQRDILWRDQLGAQEAIDAVGKKVEVFVVAQKEQVYCDTDAEKYTPTTADLFQQQAKAPVDHDGKEHQQDIDRLSPGIEKQTGDQQQIISEFCRKDEVQDHHHRQKGKKENVGAELHRQDLPRRIVGKMLIFYQIILNPRKIVKV